MGVTFRDQRVTSSTTSSTARGAPERLDDVNTTTPTSDADPNAKTTALALALQHTPIGSTGDFAKRLPPPSDAKHALGAQIEDIKEKRALAGGRALMERFDEIERLTKLGVKVRCVFDLDNTLFDTRYRTLFCAKEFDRLRGTNHFERLTADTIDMIGLTGELTASHPELALPNDVITAFQEFWKREFWNPANLVHDKPMEETLWIVREAQQRGAEISFLTGRAMEFTDLDTGERREGFFQASLAQLRNPPASLEFEDEQLVCKPSDKDKTAPFKERVMRAWAAAGEIGFFLTEGKRDIEHARSLMRDLVCFCLQCSFEDDSIDLPGVHDIRGRW